MVSFIPVHEFDIALLINQIKESVEIKFNRILLVFQSLNIRAFTLSMFDSLTEDV